MMWEMFLTLGPVTQALVAGIFTWGMTALGAGTVFLTREVNQKFLDVMLGFAAGVMIAASFWSLLLPSIELSAGLGIPEWLPAAVGFILGGMALASIDRILPHLHIGFPTEEAEGIPTSWPRSTLLVLAITMHNIPEGLAVGVAFGALAVGSTEALAAAFALAIGIGIQNFPEGMAISMPLRREGFSTLRSFWYGQLSGLVEPVAAVIGAAAVIIARPILPYALAFAAGAMIFVVVEEVIPESQHNGNADAATFGAMLGFVVMMILDVGLG
ncbi:ZIP family metal transporter [Methanogenium marinum]|uniref:ZIP family metal transporter n=1 Tax=Methanogenium marinum TaxID=348610 RepID=A0A9Q4KTH8_9EURY|nr:ZIP family metal transporter [Methanogenium marinum]MDE4907943.1 ZIP family metal transporter [Methanogenium marinum]